ncbi:MAG TPA: hypothetical protein VGG19_20640 [Tepidisphaeraceae bacterium]|jgi:hypothetical protein
MILAEQGVNMIEKAVTERQQAIADGWKRYPEILRADVKGTSTPGEARELAKLMDLLGLSPDELLAHRAAMVEFIRFQAIVTKKTAEVQEFEEQMPGVTKELDKIPSLLAEIERIKHLWLTLDTGRGSAKSQANSAHERLTNIKKTYPRAFGLK